MQAYVVTNLAQVVIDQTDISYLKSQSDVIENSVPPKSTPTANVLGGGSLAPQFASRCGKELVDDMSSPDRGTWGDGVLVVTPS